VWGKGKKGPGGGGGGNWPGQSWQAPRAGPNPMCHVCVGPRSFSHLDHRRHLLSADI
jgi:hypothetical protein